MTEDKKRQIYEYCNEMRGQKAVVRQTLFQQTLIVSTGILGFVVALHDATTTSVCLFAIYIAALCSLALTSVFSLFILVGYASMPERAIKAVVDSLKEIWDAKEDYLVGPTLPKWTVILRRITPWLFSTGVILLALYSILIASRCFI